MGSVRPALAGLLAALLLIAGCMGAPGDGPGPGREGEEGGPAGQGGDGQNDAARPDEGSAGQGPSRFPPGIYYLVPRADGPFEARLNHSERLLAGTFEVFPVGYDIQPTRLVYGDSQRQLIVVTPDGDETVVDLREIHSIGRPSLSPDGTRVAVQALEGDAVIGTPSEDLNIYVVDLRSGESTRVSHRPINEESPVWIPGSELVAYSSFDAEEGVHLHFVDVATGTEVRTIQDGGELHVGVSKDGGRVVQGPTLRVFDVSDGSLLADLGDVARTAVNEAGFAPLMDRGGFPDWPTFPLSATFSPDGDRLVFDGAVTDGGRAGIVVATIGLDGSGFELLTDLIPVDGDFSNKHNFSQVDPRWL